MTAGHDPSSQVGITAVGDCLDPPRRSPGFPPQNAESSPHDLELCLRTASLPLPLPKPHRGLIRERVLPAVVEPRQVLGRVAVEIGQTAPAAQFYLLPLVYECERLAMLEGIVGDQAHRSEIGRHLARARSHAFLGGGLGKALRGTTGEEPCQDEPCAEETGGTNR